LSIIIAPNSKPDIRSTSSALAREHDDRICAAWSESAPEYFHSSRPDIARQHQVEHDQRRRIRCALLQALRAVVRAIKREIRPSFPQLEVSRSTSRVILHYQDFALCVETVIGDESGD
jgi:hypothetical protein